MVQTSVITSAPKYGIGGNNAVASAERPGRHGDAKPGDLAPDSAAWLNRSARCFAGKDVRDGARQLLALVSVVDLADRAFDANQGHIARGKAAPRLGNLDDYPAGVEENDHPVMALVVLIG